MTNDQIAEAYRVRYPERTGGVVIIYGSHVSGWCEELPPASDWEPGCFAVAADGYTWVTVGGNPQDGAERWQPVEKEGE